MTALETENHVPLTTRIHRSVNGKHTAMQLDISSKEPVQPKRQRKFGVGIDHRVCRGLRTEVLF